MTNYFRLIHKEELIIFQEYSVPIPMSHPIQGELAVKEWMFERGMQKDCKVISESLFQQNSQRSNGELREDDIHLNYAIYQAKRQLGGK
jgi:hypothetical protein